MKNIEIKISKEILQKIYEVCVKETDIEKYFYYHSYLIQLYKIGYKHGFRASRIKKRTA